MPKKPTHADDERLIMALSRDIETLTEVKDEKRRQDSLMLNLAMASFHLIQSTIMRSGLETMPGTVMGQDLERLHGDRHMPGVLRVARFEDGSVIQLTTPHGYEDRSHVISLKESQRDTLRIYSRRSIVSHQRAVGSRPLRTDAISQFLIDPSNFMLVGDIRSLVDVQQQAGWPDAFSPEELDPSRSDSAI